LLRYKKRKQSTHVILDESGIVDGDLRDAAAISVRHHLVGAVSSAHPDSLGEDLFQFRSRSTRYQRPYQRQRIIVEVRLRMTATRKIAEICHQLR